jgi:hypothetical protein
MPQLESLQITPEVLSLIARIDEFMVLTGLEAGELEKIEATLLKMLLA